MTDETYDVIVIGGGPGGETCSAHVARAGGTVALVERDLVGGECPYWGCMPAKAMLRPGQARREALRIPGAAEAVTGELDVDAALARRDAVIRHLDDTSHAERLTKRGVVLIRGTARLDGERCVIVEAPNAEPRRIVARRSVVLAPGTRAAMPPIPGLVDAKPWTNREATTTTTIPARLGIIGGGVIGVEMAQAFASLGSAVTIIEGADRILAREEPEAAALVEAGLRASGVMVHCGDAITKVERTGDGVVVSTAGDDHAFDELLVATGRVANTEHVGLDSVDVKPGRGGFVEVLDCMHLEAQPWLYVVGDANGRAQFTHTAVYQGKVAARNSLGLETYCVEDEVAAPRVVFTEPNLCAVGHTVDSAERAGLTVTTYDRDPQRTAGGSFYGRETDGLARLVVDDATGCIVGATFVGADIAELLHSATVAIVGTVPFERLRHCVAPFPTRSDVWGKLIELVDRDEEREAFSAARD